MPSSQGSSVCCSHDLYAAFNDQNNIQSTLWSLAYIYSQLGYAVYFDHKRRNDPEFRKALKKESRREARAAKEQEEAEGEQQKEAIKAAVNQAKEEGFPTDVEDKEAFFMNEVGHGEVLCQDSKFNEGLIEHFRRY